MRSIFVVIRPDAEDDFVLAGVFANPDAATACATDPNADYEGRVMVIDADEALDTYQSPYDDDKDDEDD